MISNDWKTYIFDVGVTFAGICGIINIYRVFNKVEDVDYMKIIKEKDDIINEQHRQLETYKRIINDNRRSSME
jgi:hypothetical protein